jgi:hypothetical protein
MDKVAEFYARWFAKKAAQEYWAAESASEELAKELIGSQVANARRVATERQLAAAIEHLGFRRLLIRF